MIHIHAIFISTSVRTPSMADNTSRKIIVMVILSILLFFYRIPHPMLHLQLLFIHDLP
jgi:hypothetical protein